jgi:hypothetical protein
MEHHRDRWLGGIMSLEQHLAEQQLVGAKNLERDLK